MQLHIQSDTTYLVVTASHSRIAAYIYLGSITRHSTTVNAPVHVECQILKHVVSSAAEAETVVSSIIVKLKFLLNGCWKL